MQIKIENININRISFSPVDRPQDEDEILKNEFEDIKQNIKQSTKVDERVLGLFKGYIEYVWNNESKKAYSANIKSPESQEYDIKTSLAESLSYDFKQSDTCEKFDDMSKRLAYELILSMRERGNPQPGILFTLHANVKNKPYICILKVDVKKEDMRIWFDDEDLQIKYEDIKNTMPSPEKLQKGAIYSHPIFSQDLKILQEGYTATYFDLFLKCDRNLNVYKQFKSIPEMLKEIQNEYNDDEAKPNIESTIIDEFDKLNEGKLFGTQNLIQCAKTVAPNTPNDLIHKKVNELMKKEEISEVHIEKEATMKYKKEIIIGDITIKGPFKAFDSNVKIKKLDNQTYEVIIKGNIEPTIKISPR